MNQGEENSPAPQRLCQALSEAVKALLCQAPQRLCQDFMNVPVHSVDSKVAVLVNFLLLKYRMKEPVTKVDMLQVINVL